jgi:hypothetical protein
LGVGVALQGFLGVVAGRSHMIATILSEGS